MSSIILDKSLHTNSYRKYARAVATGKRYIVIYGGSNSSKSFSVHQYECEHLLEATGDTAMLRKNGAKLRESCYKLIVANYNDWGMGSDIDAPFSGDNRFVIDKLGGHKFGFFGAQNVDDLKSVAGYIRAVMEEGDQFEFEDFTELDRRIRDPFAITQIIIILNPVSEDHWVNVKLINGEAYKDQVEVVHCTYHDNQYASPEDIAILERMRLTDFYQYEVYCLGKWGQIRTGKEYIFNFVRQDHVKKCDFIPGQPVHLAWDFNSNPYLTLLCFQIVRDTNGGWIVQQFDEICGESPANSVEAVSEIYLQRYHYPYLHIVRVSPAFLYGDAQGNNKIEGTANERRYDWVKAALKPVLHNHSDRTLRQNPSVIRQRDFFNHLLAGKYDITWVVDPRCVNTIQDYSKLKQGPIGFLVEYAKDAVGNRYEKYGHCYTAGSYFAVGVFPKEFENDMIRK